jgi:TolB-like protein
VAGLVLAAVLTAASVAVVRVRQSARSQADAESSIAVLPFENVSRDREDSVLVDGLSEELTSALSKMQNVRVIARASTIAFRNRGLKVPHIADSLGVAHIVEGSVQKSGSHFRVRVRLVNASDGSTRWTESYDRERGDILVVQSEIAEAVARELGLRLRGGTATPRPHAGTHSIAAYELYLRGRDPIHFRSPTDSGPLEGLALLQQAVALDSGYAAAYAHMPNMYYALTAYADLDRARRLKQLADSTAALSVQLDPSLPEAYTALGKASQIGLSDLPAAEVAFRHAIALGGSPRVHEYLADNLSWSGRSQEALEEALRSARDDPLSASAAAEVGKNLCLNHRYAEGIAELARVATVRPPLQRAPFYTAICYVMQERWPDAIARLHASPDPRVRSLLGYTLARSGRAAEARQIQSDLLARWRAKGRGGYELAIVTAGLGDNDQAFEWLDRAVDDLSLYGYIMYPLFKELQADPRFERFRERLRARSRVERAVPGR